MGVGTRRGADDDDRTPNALARVRFDLRLAHVFELEPLVVEDGRGPRPLQIRQRCSKRTIAFVPLLVETTLDVWEIAQTGKGDLERDQNLRECQVHECVELPRRDMFRDVCQDGL